jgi:hypothetical protein
MRTILIAAAAALAAAIAGAATVWYFQPFVRAPAPASNPPVAVPAAPPTHPQLPRMQVIAQFGGPLQDTLIQRLRDPVDGTTCYLYLPIAVHHTPPGPETGYVEYGANSVGSISCFAAPPSRTTAAPAH